MTFDVVFHALTGHEPFCWQKRLYNQHFATGDVPPRCSLPTGLGKTSVIAIWLIALAKDVERGCSNGNLPRRLVYIVNRRTVVDQATEEAGRLRERLLNPPPGLSTEHLDILHELSKSLRQLAGPGDHVPFALSTLRGEFADNGEWKVNPAKPAIIIGTVDMIGSKLLFQGYGDGRYLRPHHSGLLGQDTLIIHDEAHLSPAFNDLIRSIVSIQKTDKSLRPVRIMELSATPRFGHEHDEATFGLTADDEQDRTVHHRLHARKRLVLETCADRKKVTQRLTELALGHAEEGCRVLVYVRFPEDAQCIHSALQKSRRIPNDHLALLTGTMRGFERDKLADTPLFRWFCGGQPMDATAYLVSTSAGEVGVDLDADHMVCDLSTLESMIQRFGRVNRKPDLFPEPEQKVAQIHVVAEQSVLREDGKPTKDESESSFKARQATWQALCALPITDDDTRDASPIALRQISTRMDAWSPKPDVPALTDILLDAWSLTSLHALPGRPPVSDWLHGIPKDKKGEPPETYVLWRKEISVPAKPDISAETAAEILDAFPIRTCERLRDRTRRVVQELGKIASRCSENRVLLVRDNDVVWEKLGDLVSNDSKLANATIILPTEVGGLENGYLNGCAEECVKDVAERTVKGQVARQRVWVYADGTEEPICGGEVDFGCLTRFRVCLRDDELAEDDSEGNHPIAIEYRICPMDPADRLGAWESREPILLNNHTDAVVDRADAIVGSLNLPSDIAEAIRLAARWHDAGKAREVWQRAAHNTNPQDPIAKSGKRGLNSRALEGYRHELGSLLEAAAAPDVRQHPERDLILHLIAAHHGWARPHFDPDAQDPDSRSDENHEAITEAMRRYARLQQRFGRWGLAWLEAILRCADGLASAPPQPDGHPPSEKVQT